MKMVSVQEMQEMDRKTIEDIGMPSIMLMENAGRCVAHVALDMLGGPSNKEVAIFSGIGNNGGDGFVAARYLTARGIKAKVFIVGDKKKIKNDPLVNLHLLEKLNINIEEAYSPIKVTPDLIIDSIFGIGLKGEVKEPTRSIISSINKLKIPIVSVDVPSGLDADTGEVLGEAIIAQKTVTMQFAKKGFYTNKGMEYTGEVIVVDIGIKE
ncbi:MAG: NAD(P)H-hydrate epimerase [Candidatus Omnitrophota bacterium]